MSNMIKTMKEHPIMVMIVLGTATVGGILGPTILPDFSLPKAIFAGVFFGAHMGLLMIGSSIMNTSTIPRFNRRKTQEK